MQAHAKGFAFLIPDDRDHPDVYINANDLNSAMNGDIVFVKVTARGQGGRPAGRRSCANYDACSTQIVGVFQSQETYGFVIADDKRILGIFSSHSMLSWELYGAKGRCEDCELSRRAVLRRKGK